jgi:hypothetical protein
MKMTCECTEEVSGIVLIPLDNRAIFNVTTHRVLDDGTKLSPENKTETVEIPDELLKQVMALNVTKDPRMAHK